MEENLYDEKNRDTSKNEKIVSACNGAEIGGTCNTARNVGTSNDTEKGSTCYCAEIGHTIKGSHNFGTRSDGGNDAENVDASHLRPFARREAAEHLTWIETSSLLNIM